MEADPSQRKRAFNGRFKTPRSRSGCTLCRRRRVKCDEQKPSCKRCCNGGLQCTYEKQLLWPDEPRSVGKPRGVRSDIRASVESSTSRCSQPTSSPRSASSCSAQSAEGAYSKWLNPFVDCLLADFNTVSRDDAPKRHETGYSQQGSTSQPEADDDESLIVSGFHNSLSTVRPSTAYPTQESSPFTKQLFDFYLHRMCLRCILLDKNSHSYRKVVVPIALQSSLVFNALLALAASQMLPYQADSSYRQKTLQYQGYSLRTLAHRISRLDESSGSEILAAILMLCLLELMHNTFRRGVSDSIDVDVHAYGAQRVLESPTFDSTKPHNVEMSSFLGHMLSARYLLQFTCHSDRVGHADAEARTRYWLARTTRPAREVNCFAGCSNELLSLLCDIVSAIRQHGSHPFPANELDVLKAAFRTGVQDVEQQDLLRQESVPQFASISSEANRFLVIAEAYRHAAIILIELYLCPQGSPAGYHLVEEHLLAIFSERSMRSAFAIPPPGKACRSSPLWPIFIASCHVVDESLQVDIAAYFSHAIAQDSSTIDILNPMLATLRGVWQAASEPLHLLANSAGRFPWEYALAGMGWELCWA